MRSEIISGARQASIGMWRWARDQARCMPVIWCQWMGSQSLQLTRSVRRRPGPAILPILTPLRWDGPVHNSSQDHL